jgi:hypothetical protein
MMKETTVKLMTTAAVVTPAMWFAAEGAVQIGVEGTKCLKETMEPCPATDLLAVDPDMPVETGGGEPVPMRVPFLDFAISTTVSITGLRVVFGPW